MQRPTNTRKTPKNPRILQKAQSFFWVCSLVALFLTPLFAELAFAGTNVGVSYQGRIVRPSGEAVNAGVVAFSLRVFDPTNNCLLWSEVQNVNMAGTGGAFSLVVGAGTRTDGGAHTLKQVFTNAGTLSSLTCTAGSTYTPTANEDRNLSVTFNDGGTVVALSTMAIKSAPFALQADQVSGYGILNLAKISGAGSATTFTPFQYDFLAALAAPASASSTPCAANDILKFVGGVWTCAADATGGAPGDASYAAKGTVQFNTDAATSGVSVAAGVATVNTGIAANQIPKLDASANLGVGIAPTSRLDVNGAITQRGMAAPAVSAAGTGRIYYDSTSNHFYYSENGGGYTQLSAATGALSSVSSISNAAGDITLAPITTTGAVVINSGTPSVGSASGALVVTGGIGASGSIYTGGSINAGTTMTAATSIYSPQLYGASTAAGDIKIDGTSHATKGNVLLATSGSGKVGIGTTGPYTKFHVVGNTVLQVDGNTYASSSGAADGPAVTLNLYNSNAGAGSSSIISGQVRNSSAVNQFGYFGTVSTEGAGTYAPSLVFGTQTGAASYAERMRIDENGRVGIGTVSPSHLLTVGGDVRINGTISNVVSDTTVYTPTSAAASAPDANLYAVNYGQTDGAIAGIGFQTTNSALGYQSAYVSAIANTAGHTPTIVIGQSTGATAYAERMRIDQNGNVGIGTTAPFSLLANTNTNPLDQNNKGAFSASSLTWSHANNAYAGSISNTGTGADMNGLLVKITETASTAKALTVNVAGTDKLTVNGSGYVGIGTNAPTAALDVNGALTQRGMAAPAVSAAGTGRIYFDSTANKFKVSQDGGAFADLVGGGGGGGLSSITAATGIGSIDNTNYAQTWAWSTATTQNPMTMSANAMTTGSILNITTSSASLNSTSGLLNVANTGASTNGVVARIQSNSTAGSGLTVLANGNVGIGTAAPGEKLTVAGAVVVDAAGANTGSTVNALLFGTLSGSGEGIGSKRNGGGNQNGLDFFTNYSSRLSIANGGNIGVGTASPAVTLDVAGATRVSGFPVTATSLTSSIGAGVTTIPVASTAGYPSTGILQHDSEIVYYTGTTGTSFTGVTRGYNGTTANGMNNGDAIVLHALNVSNNSTALPLMSLLANGGFTVGKGNKSTNASTIIMGVNNTGVLGGNAVIGTANSTGSQANYSTVIGNVNTVTGEAGVALGNGLAVDSYGAVAIGQNTKSMGGGETVLNWVSTDAQLLVGVGSGAGAQANGLVMFKNGKSIFNSGALTNTSTPTITTVMNNAALTTMGSTSNNTAAAFNATNLAGTSLMYIRNDGNVGIGTAAPGAKLDVSGDASINGLTVGRGAGAVATNSALGSSALAANTTGAYNTAVGVDALKLNTTAQENTAIGQSALSKQTSSAAGGYNTAVGSAALANYTAAENDAFGYQALMNATTGSENSAFGSMSGKNITTGQHNASFGYSSLSAATTGSFNAAFGKGAGHGVTTGGANTMLGYQSGYNITTGDYNIIVGYNVNAASATASYQLNIGDLILGDLTAASRTLDVNGSFNVRGLASAPAVSPAGQGKIYFDSAANKFKVSQNGGAYADLVGGGSGVTSVVASTGLTGGTITSTGTIAVDVGTNANQIPQIGANKELQTAGQMASAVYDNVAATSFDFNNGNMQYTTANCGAITLSNMLNGGTYTIAIRGTTPATCSFTHAGLTFKFVPTLSNTSGETIFTFVRMGTIVYTTWISGF